MTHEDDRLVAQYGSENTLTVAEIRILKHVAKLHETSRILTGIVTSIAVIGAFVIAVWDHIHILGK